MRLRKANVNTTLTLDDAAGQTWDILVIGAGPAGVMVAYEAVATGARVLLVDRARFPRQKVCGCCLNGASLELLNQVGLGELPHQLGAPKLHEFQLAHQGRIAKLPLDGGVSLSRERFDAALIWAAVGRGVEFLGGTHALVQEVESGVRQTKLRVDNRSAVASARIVVVASGLGASCFNRQHDDQRITTRSSRIGAGTVLSDSSVDIRSGSVCMACHRYGYVGLVRLEDGRLDVAAALDGVVVKRSTIDQIVSRIIDESGLPLPKNLERANWHGTAKLSQRRDHVAGDRYFVVGDAACYVEPFTGEGIAWALATGKAVTPFALESLTTGTTTSGPAWEAKHRALMRPRMRLCRTISYLLREPAIIGLAVRLLVRSPGLARPIIRSLNASFTP